jgi:hypothetical protein
VPAEHEGDRLLHVEACRLVRDRLGLRHPGIFGVPAEDRAGHGDDLVAGREPRDLVADSDDHACDVHAEHRLARTEHPERDGHEEAEPLGQVAAAHAVVGDAHGAGVHADEQLVGPRRRGGSLLDAHRLGATESVGDSGAHSRCLLPRGLLRAQLLLGIHPCISLPYIVSLTL